MGMSGIRRTIIASVVIAIIAAAATAAAMSFVMVQPRATLEPPRERIIWMEAVEFKGSTTVGKLAPPDPKSVTIGPAFGFKWVKEGEEWQVSKYSFNPAVIVVNQGDKVTLRMFGVNGDVHTIIIEHYLPTPQTLNRGRFLDISFTADRPGTFQLICTNHEPGMRGWLIVLPRA
jgi:plastocyanin